MILRTDFMSRRVTHAGDLANVTWLVSNNGQLELSLVTFQTRTSAIKKPKRKQDNV